MKKLLHIIATPRGADSRTLKVSNVFIDTFMKSHEGWTLEEIDLFKEDLPSITALQVDGKFVLLSGKELAGELKTAWQDIEMHIDRFLSADAYVLSTPMWNFSVQYMLKHYFDVIVQPKALFRYTKTGVEGLVKDKRMTVIISRGGDYSIPVSKALDQQEPYLRTLFGFIGITSPEFVIAQPMDMGEALQKQKIKEAQEKAAALAMRR